MRCLNYTYSYRLINGVVNMVLGSRVHSQLVCGMPLILQSAGTHVLQLLEHAGAAALWRMSWTVASWRRNDEIGLYMINLSNYQTKVKRREKLEKRSSNEYTQHAILYLMTCS